MNKILVDTNILVYSIDEDSKFHTISKKLVQNPNYNLYTTSKNLSEFLVVLTRALKVSVTVEEALNILEDLMAYFTILYPSDSNLYSNWMPNPLRAGKFRAFRTAIPGDSGH